MSAPLAPPADHGPEKELPPSVYRGMANVLRLGLLVSLTILTVALVAVVAHAAATSSGPWIAMNDLVRYLDLGRFGHGLLSGEPEAYLTLGVYALVATPILRVVTGTVAFARNGERPLAVITLTVLILLLVGLFVIGPLVR